MLHKVYATVRNGIRDWGVLATACYVLNNIAVRVFDGKVRLYLYRLQILPVPDHGPQRARRAKQFEIREVHAGDPVLAGLPRTAAVIQYRYEQGSRCHCAFHDRRLVGQLWLQFDSYLEDEVRTRFNLLPPQEMAWDYDVYVDAEYRGSGLFGQLWEEAFKMLRHSRKRWCASRVSAWNTASLKAHGHLGARDVGKALYCVVGRLQLMLSSLAPYVHVSVSGRSPPVLAITMPPDGARSALASGQNYATPSNRKKHAAVTDQIAGRDPRTHRANHFPTNHANRPTQEVARGTSNPRSGTSAQRLTVRPR